MKVVHGGATTAGGSIGPGPDGERRVLKSSANTAEN
jgi:hypothetical protein